MECSSSHRKLLQSLIYSAVQRCRMAESPCRLSVSLKCLQNPNSPSLRVSVSDTGVGSTLEEFLELDVLALETPAEKWDGTLLITSTGINEKVIYRYRLNLQEEISSRARLIKLAPTYKSHATFSGTEVCLCLSNEADVDGFILWMAGFIRKILILRAANLACELLVGKTGSAGSRNVCLLHDSDDVHLSVTMPSIQRLVSGLKDYALSHGNTYDRECETCYTNRGHLKVGAGAESTVERRRAKGLVVEVVIVIARTVSDSSCWMVNCSSTQVLYFKDFIPCSISQSCFNVLMNMDWQSYGFKLKGCYMDDEGNAVLEWDSMAFARIDIAIHSYHGRYPLLLLYICFLFLASVLGMDISCGLSASIISQTDRNLVRKALKAALDDLKANHTGDFLSSHAQKIRKYVPDLSQSIAGLIFSSNDSEFRDECIAVLGLGSDQAITEGAVESCICEKMTQIVEVNDTRANVEKDNAPYLFECEKLDEDNLLDQEGEGDEYMIFDF